MHGNVSRQMRLTKAHVAKLAQKLPDPGFIALPGFRMATDEDYDRIVAELIEQAPEDGFWVFAYGSLIWNPAYEFVEQRIGVVYGWHRAFCLGWDKRYRGNPDAPGLMLALDRGGQCRGVLHRLPEADLEANVHRLVRREMSMVPSAFPARWVNVKTGGGRLRALTFAMNRKSGRYVSGLSIDELADVLAVACGHRGSMAEYLFSTVSHLEQLGIHDRHLWSLQELVALRIEARHGL